MKRKCPLENAEAKMFKDWADYHPIVKLYLAPIPNGGSRNKLEALNMRRRGQTRAGVSDYFLAYPVDKQKWDDKLHGLFTTHCNGLWIELKRRDKTISKPTPEQREWLERMTDIGYATVVAYGADEAIKAVEEYLR